MHKHLYTVVPTHKNMTGLEFAKLYYKGQTGDNFNVILEKIAPGRFHVPQTIVNKEFRKFCFLLSVSAEYTPGGNLLEGTKGSHGRGSSHCCIS